MYYRNIVTGLAALLCAVPVAAQERGALEFGAFGSAASFDNALSLKTGYGGGGRIGVYLDRNWLIEFEDAEMRATRPNGLRDVNVGLLTGRLIAVPIVAGSLSLLAGVGAGLSTETNFLHSYGLDALVGAKVALRDNVSMRLDGVMAFLANEDWKSHRSVRLGMSVFRRPSREVVTLVETRTVASAPVMTTRPDSVSAEETRRLRDRDAALRMLRDSLRNAPRAPMATAAMMETMEERIHFAFDKAELTDSAKKILDDKIATFRANPTMTIVMVGYTDVKGTDAYNMALGERRAEATKSYIVARGIESERVLMESKGERAQIPNSEGSAGEAQNRRVIFRLLMTPDVIRKP